MGEALDRYRQKYDFSDVVLPLEVYCDMRSGGNSIEKLEEKNNILCNFFTIHDDCPISREEKKKKSLLYRKLNSQRSTAQ